MEKLRGTGVALVTPFTPNGELDLPALQRVVEHLVSGGVEFLVPLGTTGETVTLTPSEQERVVEAVQEANAGRCPVAIGCGGNNTAAVVERLKVLDRRFQPEYFMSASPAYNKPSQEGIYRHYKALSEATDRPLIVYNVPGRTSSNILPTIILRLAQDCRNIVAVKEASGILQQGLSILREAPAHFSVLSGDDALGFAQVAAGYDGIISVIGNAYPKEFSDMTRAGLANDLPTGQRLNQLLQPLMHSIFLEGNPAGIKAVLDVLGICGPHVRLPLVAASDDLQVRLRNEVEALHRAKELA